ncbi:hypothetical protein [Saliphagus infecundisoli]|uniref:DUF7984 domain-containing protein n=1 Tax=Saliphagus infecundisoli TaxID=1849069 RepID=A0ABD5QFL4_9EURY|nr:hypothetical protein [Saliphagus infecundisoli]
MDPRLELTPARVAAERNRIRDRGERVVPLINDVRGELGERFGIDVAPVDRAAYREEVDAVFADGDLAVNVAALASLLRGLDVEGDYPGFVVDELLGRELAATIAGTQPLRTLGEATFHYADIHVHGSPGEAAGVDDLEAALAAGFGERLSGWRWPDEESPFAVE